MHWAHRSDVNLAGLDHGRRAPLAAISNERLIYQTSYDADAWGPLPDEPVHFGVDNLMIEAPKFKGTMRGSMRFLQQLPFVDALRSRIPPNQSPGPHRDALCAAWRRLWEDY